MDTENNQIISEEEVVVEQPTEDAAKAVEETAENTPSVADEIAAEETAEQEAQPTEENAQEAQPTANERAGMRPRTRKMSRRHRRIAKKRQRLLSLDKSTDIRYRGPLSYRTLRIVGWVFVMIAFIGSIVAFLGKRGDSETMQKVGQYLTYAFDLMMPLFLVATFATLLNNSRKFSSLLAMYGFFSVLFVLLYLFLHDRIAVGIAMAIMKTDRASATLFIDTMIAMFYKKGYMAFNIFIDLFLCTLFTFFMLYRPKKVFVGKKLIVFRLFALLPVAYEIASIVVRVLTSLDVIETIPFYLNPLLTTKPPLAFPVFVALTFFIKNREKLYRKHGKTHEQYLHFLDTNLNSLHFSSLTCKLFAIAAAVDFVMTIVLIAVMIARGGGEEEAVSLAVTQVTSWGVGSSVPLFLAIPFVMLFSYTRTYKDTRLDIIIPLVAVIVLLIVGLEGGYRIALTYLAH